MKYDTWFNTHCESSCEECNSREECRERTRNRWQWDPSHPFARRWYFWTIVFTACAFIGLTIGVTGTWLIKTFLI